jgi:vanillate O-demethylase monooxygenase subunit
VDQKQASDELVTGLRPGMQEDADALALPEIRLQTRQSGEFDVLIAQDAGVAKAHKVMARLLAAERQGAVTTAELETTTA